MSGKKNFLSNFKPYLKNDSWKKLEARAGEYRVEYEKETDVQVAEKTEEVIESKQSQAQQDLEEVLQEEPISEQETTFQETEDCQEELTLYESIETEQTPSQSDTSIHSTDTNEPVQQEILENIETLKIEETSAALAEEKDTENQRDLDFIKDKLQKISNELEIQLEHYSTNEMLDQVIETQKELKTDFETKLKYDQHKDRMIDRLHKEVQEYKEDIIKSALLPLVRDLIMINDNIHKLVENYRTQHHELDGEEILNHLEFVTQDIDDALYRQGIESFEYMSEKVDHVKQKIFKTIRSGDSSKERKVAERMRKGYEWDDKVIRKELVNVYVYDEALDVAKKIREKEGVEKK